MAVVYALVSSIEPNEVRYVGVSSEPQRRLETHRKDTTSDRAFKVNAHKIRWQRKVFEAGGTIDMIILAEFDTSEEAFNVEDEFICAYREDGHPLTNKAAGGNGGFRYADPDELAEFYRRRSEARDTPEFREKLSRISRDKWADPEYREKALAAMHGGLTREVRDQINESNRKVHTERKARGETLDPEMLAARGIKLSVAGKKYFEEPENRAKTAKATKDVWASRTPEEKARISYKAKMTARYNRAKKNGWVLELTPKPSLGREHEDSTHHE